MEENDRQLLDLSDSDPDDEDQKGLQPPQNPEELAQRWVLFDYSHLTWVLMHPNFSGMIAIGIYFKLW